MTTFSFQIYEVSSPFRNKGIFSLYCVFPLRCEMMLLIRKRAQWKYNREIHSLNEIRQQSMNIVRDSVKLKRKETFEGALKATDWK
jgi:hypothetical protein